MDRKISKFGSLIITDDGDVYNTETERILSLFNDARGNPLFRSPDTKSNWRLDYIMAMMFLNNGEFISNIKEYFVLHKDNNPENCKLDNLELITDPERVNELRFSFLKGKSHSSNYERSVLPLYVANKSTCNIEVYSIREFSKKFKVSESTAVRMAKNCDRIYKDNFNLYVCETMLEAWEML